MTLATRILSACSVAALAVTGALILPASASAAGVGDASGAVLYEADGPIGTVLADISNDDDDETTIALPFDLNFFGVESSALCITTNGVVAPVPTTSDECGSDYDEDLATYALDEQVSVIGALLADNDPGEVLWKDQGQTVTGYQWTSEVLTFTTAEPHGLSVGDDAHVWDPEEFGYFSDSIDAVPSATTFSFDYTGGGDDDTSFIALTGAALGEPYGEGEDDGFGETTSIYAGATTFDGKPAFAITWYRVPTNDTENAPWLSNTYQIVLVQEPTTDTTDGYDFTIQFNFGTLTDDNDGYEAGDGNESCDSDEPETCRWSVGLARYDADTDTAEEFEFFADYPITEIVDGGATPLVSNSLNSDVLGRYILGMFAGEVSGYAVPTLVAPGAAAPQALPNTGVEPALLLAPVAALALLAGAVLLVLRRRTAQ